MRDLQITGIAKFLIVAMAMSVRLAVLVPAQGGVEPVRGVAHAQDARCAPHPVKFPCFREESKGS
jgi:hypothetical protein